MPDVEQLEHKKNKYHKSRLMNFAYLLETKMIDTVVSFLSLGDRVASRPY